MIGNQEESKSFYKIILKQYEEMINYLKENGALLNNIRPYFLLSFADYNNFLRSTSDNSNVNLNY